MILVADRGRTFSRKYRLKKKTRGYAAVFRVTTAPARKRFCRNVRGNRTLLSHLKRLSQTQKTGHRHDNILCRPVDVFWTPNSTFKPEYDNHSPQLLKSFCHHPKPHIRICRLSETVYNDYLRTLVDRHSSTCFEKRAGPSFLVSNTVVCIDRRKCSVKRSFF